MNNVYTITAVWVALALISSVISIRIGLPVALVEVVGAVAGNLPLNHLIQQTDYTALLASIGSVPLAGQDDLVLNHPNLLHMRLTIKQPTHVDGKMAEYAPIVAVAKSDGRMEICATDGLLFCSDR
jgi:hypothetical protein